VRVWVLTSLAEMAARAGMAVDAQGHFREALALDAADNYLLGAYADFLACRSASAALRFGIENAKIEGAFGPSGPTA
jgi:hypothetical protein